MQALFLEVIEIRISKEKNAQYTFYCVFVRFRVQNVCAFVVCTKTFALLRRN